MSRFAGRSSVLADECVGSDLCTGGTRARTFDLPITRWADYEPDDSNLRFALYRDALGWAEHRARVELLRMRRLGVAMR